VRLGTGVVGLSTLGLFLSLFLGLSLFLFLKKTALATKEKTKLKTKRKMMTKGDLTLRQPQPRPAVLTSPSAAVQHTDKARR
jgi:hypothetical protein